MLSDRQVRKIQALSDEDFAALMTKTVGLADAARAKGEIPVGIDREIGQLVEIEQQRLAAWD